jgi:hypothetical protein
MFSHGSKGNYVVDVYIVGWEEVLTSVSSFAVKREGNFTAKAMLLPILRVTQLEPDDRSTTGNFGEHTIR